MEYENENIDTKETEHTKNENDDTNEISKVISENNDNNTIEAIKTEEYDNTESFMDEDTSKIRHKKENKNYKQNANKNERYKSWNEDLQTEFCSDATYLAQEIALGEKLSRTDTLKLFNLNVTLRHTVLPQHMIETRAGSHMPTREQIKKFKSIVPLKKGSYSLKEDHIIIHNWKVFCKLHDWDKKNFKPFLQLRIGSNANIRHITERRKFVQFLADGLPNRTLYSVYHRFRNLYEGNVTRRYKPEEDQMIIDHLENNMFLEERRKYVDLAKVLRRTRHSIWRRYQILKRRNKKKFKSI